MRFIGLFVVLTLIAAECVGVEIFHEGSPVEVDLDFLTEEVLGYQVKNTELLAAYLVAEYGEDYLIEVGALTINDEGKFYEHSHSKALLLYAAKPDEDLLTAYRRYQQELLDYLEFLDAYRAAGAEGQHAVVSSFGERLGKAVVESALVYNNEQSIAAMRDVASNSLVTESQLMNPIIIQSSNHLFSAILEEFASSAPSSYQALFKEFMAQFSVSNASLFGAGFRQFPSTLEKPTSGREKVSDRTELNGSAIEEAPNALDSKQELMEREATGFWPVWIFLTVLSFILLILLMKKSSYGKKRE